jgi:selenocysteine lyase/cysteine desulfurase
VQVEVGTIAEAQSLWRRPDGIFLNSATYGLPPTPAWEAFQAALEEWRAGTGVWERWSEDVDRARASWARLVHVQPERVTAGATVAELVSLVAAAVPDGTRVLAPEGDFTSLVYPFAEQAHRGVTVTEVPLAQLAERVNRSTDVVAFSAVQSSSGEVADLDAVAEAAAGNGAVTVVDATQACGWLPLDASRFDAVACHTYKWLMSPRGAALMAVRPPLADELRPLHANWFAAEDIFGSYYGLPPRLASTARRLDDSPAWFSWVGTAATLEVVESIGIERIHEHDVALANRFRGALGLPPSNSAIVSVRAENAAERLAAAGVRAATRAGSARLAFHVYNTDADADAAAAALA